MNQNRVPNIKNGNIVLQNRELVLYRIFLHREHKESNKSSISTNCNVQRLQFRPEIVELRPLTKLGFLSITASNASIFPAEKNNPLVNFRNIEQLSHTNLPRWLDTAYSIWSTSNCNHRRSILDPWLETDVVFALFDQSKRADNYTNLRRLLGFVPSPHEKPQMSNNPKKTYLQSVVGRKLILPSTRLEPNCVAAEKLHFRI